MEGTTDAEALRTQAESIRDGDPVTAAGLYRQAAGMGDAQSASSLGYMLMVGEGVPQDLAEAERYLRIASSSGESTAMCNLGVLLSDSDPDETLRLFEAAAELGSLRAVKNLAAMHGSGNGVPMDRERAAGYYRKGADMGDIDSMCVLASMLRNGDGVPVDKPGAAELYRRAADLGDREAQYDLAFMLDSGEGVPADRAEAERLFRLSAEQGDTDACLCLGGILYERSEFGEAERWFMDAALQGDVKASYNLGLMYMDGSLGEPDAGKASEWFEAAAEEGFVLAQTMMGSIRLDSGDVPGAERWFRMAADAGEPTAQYNLGALALSGQIGMDEKEVIELLTRAASAGMQEAGQLLSALLSRQ